MKELHELRHGDIFELLECLVEHVQLPSGKGTQVDAGPFERDHVAVPGVEDGSPGLLLLARTPSAHQIVNPAEDGAVLHRNEPVPSDRSMPLQKCRSISHIEHLDEVKNVQATPVLPAKVARGCDSFAEVEHEVHGPSVRLDRGFSKEILGDQPAMRPLPRGTWEYYLENRENTDYGSTRKYLTIRICCETINVTR